WPWSQYLHQFWLNFAGAFTGWVVVWLLWRKFGAEKPPEFGAWDFIGVLVALVGVTGHLPMAAVGLAYGVAGAGVALVRVFRDWIIEKLKADAGKGTP